MHGAFFMIRDFLRVAVGLSGPLLLLEGKLKPAFCAEPFEIAEEVVAHV